MGKGKHDNSSMVICTKKAVSYKEIVWNNVYPGSGMVSHALTCRNVQYEAAKCGGCKYPFGMQSQLHRPICWKAADRRFGDVLVGQDSLAFEDVLWNAVSLKMPVK